MASTLHTGTQPGAGDRATLGGDPAARAAFIRAMRAVASSVTVVTTGGTAGRHGATVSAFCSVSADPPSVLVCLKADSRIARAVAANGAFCVNVLPRARADIANRFAGQDDHRLGDRFEGIDCAGEPVPAIAGATAFLCRLKDSLESGSHRIFVGHVENVLEGAAEPLAYLNGAYHRVVPQSPAAD
jgi:flavin reductase (DIM6/NTAB) family NADH-FMN oxidoreductase RutF